MHSINTDLSEIGINEFVWLSQNTLRISHEHVSSVNNILKLLSFYFMLRTCHNLLTASLPNGKCRQISSNKKNNNNKK